MKKLFLLSLTGILSISLLGCEDSKPTTPQPVAGNEPPSFGNTSKGGRFGKPAGTTAKKTLDAKTSLEP